MFYLEVEANENASDFMDHNIINHLHATSIGFCPCVSTTLSNFATNSCTYQLSCCFQLMKAYHCLLCTLARQQGGHQGGCHHGRRRTDIFEDPIGIVFLNQKNTCISTRRSFLILIKPLNMYNGVGSAPAVFHETANKSHKQHEADNNEDVVEGKEAKIVFFYQMLILKFTRRFATIHTKWK